MSVHDLKYFTPFYLKIIIINMFINIRMSIIQCSAKLIA